ncbi:UNVERIFIED_CONTAM: eEF1A lysine and N-terminal methyltransferase [Sesamum angustifolium]|uniref:EEF1A lysine and N-terminal methyltransferase n=1 Tax=Sesamum angustifolium TaxID=2727405 RepID=A0AAW2PU04_9LAMI
MMSLSPSTFETIVPSRYITFILPDPHHLQIAVLDSPAAGSSTAGMWIPRGRESDWIFSTFSGHLQLLLSSPTTRPLSRLILVGNSPSHPQPTSYNSTIHPSYSTALQQNLAPLLSALTPKPAFLGDGEIPEVPLLIYEDEVVKSSVLEVCQGPCVGEMLIENVELENDGVKEFRRRLRFKRMPNFVQTQIRIRPKDESCLENLDTLEFELDKGVLVQPYLSPMVAGMLVISQFLEGQLRDGFRPKALCLGVGGGALLGFLRVHLGFEVAGVEEDELAKNESEKSRFHVVMVDLDSNDPTMGVCAPPQEFLRKSVLLGARAVLRKEGVLIINAIPSSKLYYERLISKFQEVFEELYEIDVGNGENFVLIATKSKTESALDSNEGCLSE